MKIVFVGGGSFRILPIVRGLFVYPRILHRGEIRLVDKDLSRAEMVGRMIMKTPEYKGTACTVKWARSISRALDGEDALYVTMAIGDPETRILSDQASMMRGFISSDQLSATGAFLGLTGGPVILDFARKMEKYCPYAKMLIFANPVAVYSAMVNNHTKIAALGLCGGFANHRWDLTRLLGVDEYRDDYDVDVAGINHLSFILRGTCKGKDLFEIIGQHVARGWRPPRMSQDFGSMARSIRYALRKLVYMYHRFGTIIFSTEGDGMAHLFYEEMFEHYRRNYRPLSRKEIRAQAAAMRKKRQEADEQFRKMLDQDLGPGFGDVPYFKNRQFGRCDTEVTIPILKALAGHGQEKVVASLPNRGALPGFKHDTALEYSLLVDVRDRGTRSHMGGK